MGRQCLPLLLLLLSSGCSLIFEREPQANVKIETEVIQFGFIPLEGESDEQRIRWVALSQTDPLRTKIDGSKESFEVVQDGCVDRVLQAGQGCEITVRFAPDSIGPKNGIIQVGTSLSGIGTLTGDGYRPGEIRFDPPIGLFTFSQKTIEQGPETKTFRVHNTASPGAPVDATFVIDGEFSGSFEVEAEICNLDGGEDCDIIVTYTPTPVGNHVGALRVIVEETPSDQVSLVAESFEATYELKLTLDRQRDGGVLTASAVDEEDFKCGDAGGCYQLYPTFKEVTVESNLTLERWEEDCVGVAPCTVRMLKDRHVHAILED